MGEDIHIKTMVYSKIENKHIDALNMTSYPQYSTFKPFFDGRYYDLFALFGSCRSDFKQLDRANAGIPVFLNDTYREYLDMTGYYGFQWFYIDDLMKSIDEYIEKLKNPKNYFDEDDYQFELIETGQFNYDNWADEVDPLINTLEQIQKRLDEMRRITENDSQLDKLIDASKTAFLIYFDS